MNARLNAYFRLLRLDRPIGTWLLMWPTLWGLWFAADGVPPLPVLAVFVLGTIFMRAAGCAINDFADRKVDPHVERTTARPLAAGEIEPYEAVLWFVGLSLVSLGLVLTLNPLTWMLAVPAALLAFSYPFAKRYTHLPQAHLGLAFGWGVPMGFAAVTDSVPVLAWLLMAVTMLWAIAYDTFYAMVDRDDDIKIGVKSTAVLFGRHDRLITALIQVLVLLGLVAAGLLAQRGLWYHLGVAVAAALAVYQQWLIVGRERERCFAAFLNNHRFGMAVFAGLLVDTAIA